MKKRLSLLCISLILGILALSSCNRAEEDTFSIKAVGKLPVYEEEDRRFGKTAWLLNHVLDLDIKKEGDRIYMYDKTGILSLKRKKEEKYVCKKISNGNSEGENKRHSVYICDYIDFQTGKMTSKLIIDLDKKALYMLFQYPDIPERVVRQACSKMRRSGTFGEVKYSPKYKGCLAKFGDILYIKRS